jgi:hypothetical protein
MAAARRGFLKAVAIAPLTPAALVAAQAPAAGPAAGGPAVVPPPASRSDEIAEALTEVVRREHGARLDAGALARIRKRIARRLDGAERLRRAARLGNADEPVTAFDALPPAAPEQRR